MSYISNYGKAGKPVKTVISETAKRIKIEITGTNASKGITARVINDTQRILRLDEDLSGFYTIIEKEKDFAWMAKTGTGRLLRSPTVFEDLVKTICTTNCSWALTKIMVANLVGKLAEKTAGGEKAFPTAEAMAGVDEEFYRREIRAGYRSPYFVELAESVSSGTLDPEKWLTSELSTEELKKEMKKVKGVGDYAAENLLKLVGRYDGLALDSWLRSEFYKKHFKDEKCSDGQIEQHYERFGEWKGMAMWFDMSRRWLH